jgi:hypothetical protein
MGGANAPVPVPIKPIPTPEDVKRKVGYSTRDKIGAGKKYMPTIKGEGAPMPKKTAPKPAAPRTAVPLPKTVTPPPASVRYGGGPAKTMSSKKGSLAKFLQK